MRVRGDAEREAFDQAVEGYVFDESAVQWSGDVARWACDPIEADEED